MENEIIAGSRVVTDGGLRGVAVWNPMRVRDGRLRVLCAFDGYDQVVDVDRLTIEGEDKPKGDGKMVTIAKFRLGNLSSGVIARANKRDESPTMAALELLRLGLEAEKRLIRIREHCSMALRIPEAREDCLRWVLEAATIDGNEPTPPSPERSPDGISTTDLDRRVDSGPEELA